LADRLVVLVVDGHMPVGVVHRHRGVVRIQAHDASLRRVFRKAHQAAGDFAEMSTSQRWVGSILLLRPSGGAYLFIHRPLRDYLAGS
jgi:hypothetical protein